MAYQKRYRTVIPLDGSVDEAVLVWLTRESFARAAERDSLRLVEFIDAGNVDPADIPPKVDKQIGRPAAELVWRAFEGIGQRAESD